MPTIDERIAEMKSQGKTESTSKSLAKLAKAKMSSGGSTAVYGNSGLQAPTQTTVQSSQTPGITTPSTSSLGGGSAVDRVLKMQRDAIQPAVNTLQAGVPEVQNAISTQQSQLQSEKQPLEDRYKSLIDSIKGNQTTAENRQTVTTQNELGRRGLLTDTGIGQQELTNAVNPITQQYTGMIQDTGYQREADLRDISNRITNLGLTGIDKTRAIQNAIAQMQSSSAQTGIGQGLSLDSQEMARQAAEKQNAQDMAFKSLVYNTTTLPESQAQIANTRSLMSQRGQDSTGMTANDFLKFIQGGGNTETQTSGNALTSVLGANTASRGAPAYTPTQQNVYSPNKDYYFSHGSWKPSLTSVLEY